MENLARALVLCAILALPGLSSAQGSYEQFLKAAGEGDAKAVAGWLDRGLEADSTDAEGNTVLMIAARAGYLETVQALVSRKADVNRRSPHGDTALMLASLKGHLPVVRFLVDAGARVRQEGWTPLHYAAFEGRAETVKYLLGKGADKDALGPNGYTALMLCARGGHTEAARMLLYVDADPSVRGPKGETALSIARERKNAALEELLRRAGAVD
jgi:ankyrin repeat protein